MMVNPSAKEEQLYKLVKPWLKVNLKTYDVELKPNTPKEIREAYKQLQKEAEYLDF
jgi:hypothetical protein